jgi:hypothetical protein
MDREQVFQWLQQKDFDKIVEFLKTGQNTVAEDTILQHAVGHFFNEVIGLTSEPASDQTNFIFHKLFILHKQKYFSFSNEQFEKIIVYLAENSKKPSEAFSYASHVPDNTICAKIIATYNEKKPKEVAHNQTSKIQVHEIVSTTENLTTSIFNSKQEKLFFFALRNCFPTYFIYPNSALSTIINSKIVEDKLTGPEMNFFYNTTIDFIVIDQFNDFKPVFAVELDSEWHRLHNQRDKDEIKNKILKAVGLPLYRIEHMSKYKTIEEFEQVIIDMTKNSR